MSYPPPPGLRNSSTPQPHPSLPARPSHTASGSAPGSRTYSSNGIQKQPSYGSYGSYNSPAVASGAQEWQGINPPAAGAPSMPSNYGGYGGGYETYPQYHQQAQQYGQAAPQIHNPFPNPGEQGYQSGYNRGTTRPGHESYDAEYEAQIAQWQSAYVGKDEQASNTKGGNTGASSGNPHATGANTSAVGARTGPTISAAPMSNQEIAAHANGSAANTGGSDGKQKTVVRKGGGETWQDPSLLEWDPAHFRLFIGNLAGEVTDESLLKAFSKYESVQKARVVRDKRTTKSKGFGFVSFSDGDEYFQAAKDMQGKYIGSHPVQVKRSTTEIKAVNQSDFNKNKGKKGKGGGNGGHNANTGAGVQKKQAQNGKTKSGLKLLG